MFCCSGLKANLKRLFQRDTKILCFGRHQECVRSSCFDENGGIQIQKTCFPELDNSSFDGQQVLEERDLLREMNYTFTLKGPEQQWFPLKMDPVNIEKTKT